MEKLAEKEHKLKSQIKAIRKRADKLALSMAELREDRQRAFKELQE